jgi:hypothetical protein
LVQHIDKQPGGVAIYIIAACLFKDKPNGTFFFGTFQKPQSIKLIVVIDQASLPLLPDGSESATSGNPVVTTIVIFASSL